MRLYISQNMYKNNTSYALFGILCGIATTILGLMFGILMVIPEGGVVPYNFTGGCILIVLSSTGIIGVCGYLVGFMACLPCILRDSKKQTQVEV